MNFVITLSKYKNIGTQGVQELFFCELKDCGGSSIHVTVYTVMVCLI